MYDALLYRGKHSLAANFHGRLRHVHEYLAAQLQHNTWNGIQIRLYIILANTKRRTTGAQELLNGPLHLY